ncbi:brachyurin-like [Neocloeon triangulifer]|uniref:brachyurin-like n=1 Tax=Neocloeon triangulifer TaxID=2078957 RepID=UPI00286F5431|nr:brachyurin-like [Neocloeon triangulifer]
MILPLAFLNFTLTTVLGNETTIYSEATGTTAPAPAVKKGPTVFISRGFEEKNVPNFNAKAYEKNNKPKLDKKPQGKKLPNKNAGSSTDSDEGSIESQIVGGQKARLGQFPWQARINLYDANDQEYMCGGSLIDPEWILTAAHCVYGMVRFNVSLGVVKLSGSVSSRINVATTESYVHENYSDQTLNNDIALLKLPVQVELSKFVQVVRLPAAADATKNFAKQKCTISGWGKTGDDKGTSDDLKFLKRMIVENTVCASLYGEETVISSLLCIKNVDKQATCQGDSGGPFVCKEKDKKSTQVGLVSFGSSTSCIKSPSGFTRVASYLGWISEKTGLKIR